MARVEEPANKDSLNLTNEQVPSKDETNDEIKYAVLQQDNCNIVLCYRGESWKGTSVMVISTQQLELQKKLSIQRIQNKIELEAFQHKQKMKILQDFQDAIRNIHG